MCVCVSKKWDCETMGLFLMLWPALHRVGSYNIGCYYRLGIGHIATENYTSIGNLGTTLLHHFSTRTREKWIKHGGESLKASA